MVCQKRVQSLKVFTSDFVEPPSIFMKIDENGEYIIKGPEKKIEVNPKGLGWELFEGLQKHKDQIGQICTTTGVKETHGSILSRAVRTALEMRRRGVTSVDVISTSCYNNLNSVVPYLAGLFLNCKLACLDPSLSASDSKDLIKQTKPKMIFVGEEAEESITEALEGISFDVEVITFGYSPKYERFVHFLKEDPEEATFQPAVAANLMDTIIIFFSSGSVGLPKGICLNHYGLLGQLQRKKSEDTNTISMYFSSNNWISTFYQIACVITSGSKRLLIPKFNPDTAWETINIFKPTFMCAAPFQLLEMLKNGIPPGVDVSSLKTINIGGHPVIPAKLQYIRDKFPNAKVLQIYGLTEASGAVTGFPKEEITPKLLKGKLGSCGKVVEGLICKVVNPDSGEPCGPHQKGELRVKSGFFMNGHYNADSSQDWDENGWMKTGDIVYYDDDKYFYIVDRIKSMVKYLYWHLAPANIEAVISQHPDVVNVVVIGIPHDLEVEHPCGVVTLRKDAVATAEEIEKFANARLSDRQKLRAGIRIIDSFVMSPSGKIKRAEVRKRILNNL